MAQCTFTIPFPKSSQKYLKVAQKAITDAGGTFDGDQRAGNFKIPIGIGDIVGEYTATGEEICIDITKKPLLVSCKLIENRLKGYLEPPAA